MFTGLVIDVGKVDTVCDRDGVRVLSVRPEGAAFSELEVGDSVSVAGTCLTAVKVGTDYADFQVAAETLARTTLGASRRGSRLNLELPLRAGDRLGGHFVQGHVDGTGEVAEAGGTDADYRMWIRHDEPRWIVRKGSVAIDGVSLTVSASRPEAGLFEVMLIPHTRVSTTLGALGKGDRVNLEYDILAKYVGALVPGPAGGPGGTAGDRGEAPVVEPG